MKKYDKIIINRRILECVLSHNKILNSNILKNDIDFRLERLCKFRNEFIDVIPISIEDKDNCLIFINALENENYEICNNYKII